MTLQIDSAGVFDEPHSFSAKQLTLFAGDSVRELATLLDDPVPSLDFPRRTQGVSCGLRSLSITGQSRNASVGCHLSTRYLWNDFVYPLGETNHDHPQSA